MTRVRVRSQTTQVLPNRAAWIVHHARPGQPLACKFLLITRAFPRNVETSAGQ